MDSFSHGHTGARPGIVGFMQTTPVSRPPSSPNAGGYRPDADRLGAAIAKRSFATLASVSPAGHPHVAGVLYDRVAGHLFVSTMRSSRKARNIAANGRVGVCIPIRRLPIGPPSTVQFQTRAVVLDTDDPVIASLVADGRLSSITGHGELELADGCFLRIELPARVLTYGLGMPLRTLVRDPLSAAGAVDMSITP